MSERDEGVSEREVERESNHVLVGNSVFQRKIILNKYTNTIHSYIAD